MSIKQCFDKQVKVQRLVAVAGTDNEEFQPHLSDVYIDCHIQPLEDSFGEDLSGSYGKDFLMFCAVLDIKQGDKIIDNSDEYMVVGKEEYDFENKSHMELRIRKTQ